MKRRSRTFLSPEIIFYVGLLLLGGCGQGTDPFEALGDPSTTPLFSSPVDGPGIIFTGGFSAANPSLTMDLSPSGSAIRIKAPFRALITSLGGSGASLSVTGYSNAHYTWIITQMSGLDLRIGDVVKAGQEIGNGNNAMTFQVLKDASPICPYPLMDSTAKQEFAPPAQGCP